VTYSKTDKTGHKKSEFGLVLSQFGCAVNISFLVINSNFVI